MGHITRRLLLASAGTVALGSIAYGGSRFACQFVPRNHPDFFSLLDMVPDGPATRRVGRAALALGRLPGDMEGIAVRLGTQPFFRAALASDCPTTRRQLVQDQCAQDFAAGRTVTVDGWVLSETEAGLCAARALHGAVA
jgi:hypothetical protein